MLIILNKNTSDLVVCAQIAYWLASMRLTLATYLCELWLNCDFRAFLRAFSSLVCFSIRYKHNN